ncbi:YraN family protein [Zongyangia hominis]|uniref:UPF0102 protein H8709_01705 n=1 Tax=Zongyangia hominis TaxID=2763677 RepID=A0A926ECR1_9FIRM|nr:YraN family protein [Zongyangia hominis]MBC8569546.1 YraN family protein [Zongyangia hominis]
MSRRDTGRLGEDVCGKVLAAAGYQIVARNYHSRYGEIDLIAQKDGVLAFVEVKARREDSIALPREFVDIKKQRKIIKTALSYLSVTGSPLQPRFDVFEVCLDPSTGKVSGTQHIENAFEAGDIDEIF